MGDVAEEVADLLPPDRVLRRRVDHHDETHKSLQESSSSSGGGSESIPLARWTFNREGIPQAIAHRGYKARYPENTMGAFRGAVEAGAHAIETDVHLSKDNVVVISHDKDLKRCFGQTALIRDCTWDYLRTLRTVRAPPSPMPRLADVLAYLAEPNGLAASSSTWLLLDIKVDDAAEDLIPRIAETIMAAAPSSSSSSSSNTDWKHRIVLGCWTAKHLRLCHEFLPGFALAYIGIRIELAREFMKELPNVSMNMRQEPLFGIGGPRFIRDCQEDGRPLYAWTVNTSPWMRWAIEKKLDCVITDDPELYLEVARPYRDDQQEAGRLRLAKEKKKRPGMVATVRDTCFYYLVPILVRLHNLWFGHFKRVGSMAKNREELRQWRSM